MDTHIPYQRRVISTLTILLAVTLLALTAGAITPVQAAAEPFNPMNATVDFAAPEAIGQMAPADCGPTGGSGGLAPGRYETTVAGLKATVVVGKGYNPGNTTYLSFFLHGDGGKYQSYQKATNPVTKFVDERNWIFVAPQSPNGGDSWWQNTKGDHNAAFAKVLDAMFAQYNVCRNVVFGSAGSGGSAFWTTYFFPEKGGQYPAHVVVACGGNGASQQKISALAKDGKVLARTSFYFVYGTKDKLVPGIDTGISLYKGAGFNVYTDKLNGAGHCNKWKNEGFPTLAEQTVKKWGELASKVGAN